MSSFVDPLHLELIRKLDALIAEGSWDGSIFYQVVGKKLREFSEQLKQDFNIGGNDIPLTPQAMQTLIKQKSGLVEIYVSVYSTEGRNLKKWEIILSNLPRQMVGRPVYKRQKDITDVISIKENPVNDAYVVAYVTEMDILKPSFQQKTLVDRFGHELLRLKENALRVENITKFIHLTGEYSFHKDRLMRFTMAEAQA